MNRIEAVPALLAFVAGLLLAACSGGITLNVPDFSIPAGTTAGQICWAEVTNRNAVSVAAARFDATATFVQNGIGTGRAEVRIYGRASPPSGDCTGEGPSDRALSDTIALTAGEPTAVAIGDGEYGSTLASIAGTSEFWIGAKIQNLNLGTESRIEFTDGSITVVF